MGEFRAENAMHPSLLQIHHANAVEQQRPAARPHSRFITVRVGTRSARRHTPKAHPVPVVRTA